MTPARAAELLGLSQTKMDEAAIRSAFASAVRSAHPDTGGDGASLSALQQARAVLLSALAEPAECPHCAGNGSTAIRGGFLSIKCGACRGSGRACLKVFS